jgi:hypothetical protein
MFPAEFSSLTTVFRASRLGSTGWNGRWRHASETNGISPSIRMIGLGILDGYPVRWPISEEYMKTIWMELQASQNELK